MNSGRDSSAGQVIDVSNPVKVTVPKMEGLSKGEPTAYDIEAMMGDKFLKQAANIVSPGVDIPKSPEQINTEIKTQIDSSQPIVARVAPPVVPAPQQTQITSVEPQTAVEPSKQVSVPSDPIPSLLDDDNQSAQTVSTPVEEEDPLLSEELLTSSEDTTKIPLLDNFKRLRDSYRETKKALKEREKEAENVRQKIQKYESGEELPEAVKDLKAAAERGAFYEKLHSLRTSREYRDKFIIPLEERKAELKTMATAYGIPENIILQATKFQNVAELNRFLSSHFDDVGALEAKEVILDIQSIQKDAIAAEREPAQMFEKLQQESATMYAAEAARRRENINTLARSSWGVALDKIRTDGKAEELIYREGDSRHNEEIVKPFLETASKNFATEMKALIAAGVGELPEQVVTAIAHRHLLAVVSSSALITRRTVLDEMGKLNNGIKSLQGYIKPPLGGSTGSSTNGSPAQPRAAVSSAEEVARLSLAKIGIK